MVFSGGHFFMLKKQANDVFETGKKYVIKIKNIYKTII